MDNISGNIQASLIDDDNLRLIQEFPDNGIFLTGIENSDPMADGIRRDQLREAHNFYINYQDRLEKIHALGIRWLRFGMPYSQAHLSPGMYDFSFSDKIYQACNDLSINIIADMLHFGLPDWMHAQNPDRQYFQNPHFPELFAEYVKEFARRYPNIRFYTLVNEPYITAFFSSKIGIWNERIGTPWHDDTAFVRASANIARAIILSKKAIMQVWNEENRPTYPIFVQNESFEIAISNNSRVAEVERFNIRKFTALDLAFGIRDEKMRSYLLSQGMSEDEYEWFMQNGDKKDVILGIDHYSSCVHIFEPHRIIDCTPIHESQLYAVIIEYWNRYKIPMLHTETNAANDHALDVCIKTYDVINTLRCQGYPILGMGWFGDEYQVGWHHILIGPKSHEEHKVGLFYKGSIEPVGELYSQLIAKGFEPITGTTLEVKAETG